MSSSNVFQGTAETVLYIEEANHRRMDELHEVVIEVVKANAMSCQSQSQCQMPNATTSSPNMDPSIPASQPGAAKKIINFYFTISRYFFILKLKKKQFKIYYLLWWEWCCWTSHLPCSLAPMALAVWHLAFGIGIAIHGFWHWYRYCSIRFLFFLQLSAITYV